MNLQLPIASFVCWSLSLLIVGGLSVAGLVTRCGEPFVAALFCLIVGTINLAYAKRVK